MRAEAVAAEQHGAAPRPGPGGTVHLYLTRSEWCGPDLLERYRMLLDLAEAERVDRFHFAADRDRGLVTRALVRTVLSRHAGVAPAALRFRPNAFGKPALAGDAPGLAGLHFNLSHSAGMVVLAVTRAGEVGVDVEHWRARAADPDLADRFFAPAEAAHLRGAPVAARQQLFFQYWTLKEAYIKARGMGLSIDLASFAFALPDEPVIAFAPPLDSCHPRWRFWQFAVGSDHLVALCAAAASGGTTPLTFTGVVPLAGDRPIHPALLRATA